jgi:hypothetical protein
MTIHFPDRPEPWYDVDRHTITFPVLVDGQPMSCVVTAAGLMERFAGRPASTPPEVRAVYEAHKDAVRQLAEAMIRDRGATRPRAEFMIRLSEPRSLVLCHN